MKKLFDKKTKEGLPTKLLVSVLALGMVFQSTNVYTTSAEAEKAESRFASEFKSPNMEDRPMMRWWMPGAYMENDEIKREIKLMADAGYGGAEVLFFFPIPTADADPTKDYSFGSAEWNDRMKAALEAAIEYDFQLDFTLTPSWPLAIPSITDVNDERTEQGLHVGVSNSIKGTYVGQIPIPDTLQESRAKKLVTITAARVDDSVNVGKKLTLDADSTIVLEKGKDYNPENNTISWTPPAEGEWRLFSYWSQTTGHLNNSTGTPVVNHFSKEAMKAITDYWDQNLLKDPELVELYKKNAGSFFVDSLELTSIIGEEGLYGTPAEAVAMWEPHLLEEFEKRRGYDLAPYLPSIFVKGLYQYGSGFDKYDNPSEYDFNSADTGYQIRRDLLKTLTEMHAENQLEPLKDWAKTYNMTLRSQGVYSTPLDVTSTALVPDITETESWGGQDKIDFYRLQSGAAHMTGKVFSSETGARPGLGYTQTWTGSNATDNQGKPENGLLWHINRLYAGGVNQHVLHGLSYETQSVPQMYESWFMNWPGFSVMANSFSNEWGERQPYWTHMSQMAGYIARNNAVLQEGTPKVDVAVFRDRYNESESSVDIRTSNLEAAGYSYDYLNPTLLNLKNAFVSQKDGVPVLAENGPAYKALVIDTRKSMANNQQIPVDISAATAMKITDYAKSGLPIVIVGELPKRITSFNGNEVEMKQEEKLLKEQLNKLLKLPNVKQAASQDNISKVLASMKVEPAAKPAKPSDLLSVRRVDGETSYYYLYNQNISKPLDMTIELKGSGIPYELNAWNGNITPIAQFEKGKTGISTQIKLAPNSTTIIAVSTKDLTNGDAKHTAHIVKTDGHDGVYTADGNLAVRYMKAGKGKTKLSDGSMIQHNVPQVPESFQIDQWHLDLESWTPGETPTTSKKEVISKVLKELKPWSEIEGLGNVSGIGTYSTSFTIGENWTSQTGAYLQLGKVSDTFTVKVNGQELPAIDQISRTANISSYLEKGKNTLEITVATPLNNAMRTLAPSRQQQDYGLIGPVKILPYNEIELKTKKTKGKGTK